MRKGCRIAARWAGRERKAEERRFVRALVSKGNGAPREHSASYTCVLLLQIGTVCSCCVDSRGSSCLCSDGDRAHTASHLKWLAAHGLAAALLVSEKPLRTAYISHSAAVRAVTHLPSLVSAHAFTRTCTHTSSLSPPPPRSSTVAVARVRPTTTLASVL